MISVVACSGGADSCGKGRAERPCKGLDAFPAESLRRNVKQLHTMDVNFV